MSGFGGITVLLLPDGVTYYIFTDGAQFHGYGAANEINKIAPFCSQECQSPRISHGGPAPLRSLAGRRMRRGLE